MSRREQAALGALADRTRRRMSMRGSSFGDFGWGWNPIEDAEQAGKDVASAVVSVAKAGANAAGTVVSDAVGLIGKGLDEAGSLIRDFFKSKLGGQFVRLPEALFEVFTWFVALGSRMGPILDPTASEAQRKAALSNLDPFFNNSAVYQLFFDPKYEQLADCIAVGLYVISGVLVAPVAIVSVASLPANLLSQPTPYLRLVRDTISLIKDLRGGIHSTNSKLADVSALGTDYIQVCFGARVGPMTAVMVGMEVLTGLPVPPATKILGLIANDPLFQADLRSKGVNPFISDKFVPELALCMTIADANAFFNCAQGAIEVTLPGVVTNMKSKGVSIYDARVVIQSLWAAGGDPKIAFASNNPNSAAALNSLLALGVAGLVALMETSGGKNIESWFERFIGPIVPDRTAQNLRKAIKFFTLVAKVFNQYKPGNAEYAVSNPSAEMSDVIAIMNSVKWDIVKGLALVKANGIFDRFITLNGNTAMTPDMRTLLQEIAADHTFDKIGRIFCDLFASAGIQAPGCAIVVKTTAAPAPPKPTVKVTLVAPSRKGAGVAPQKAPQVTVKAPGSVAPAPVQASGTPWFTIALGTAGFLAGGPLGAAAGLAAGTALDKKRS